MARIEAGRLYLTTPEEVDAAIRYAEAWAAAVQMASAKARRKK